MIIYYLLVCLCIRVSVAALLDGFKSYKNYRVYELEGDHHEMDKIISYLENYYELPFHSNDGKKSQLLVAPDLVPIVETMAKTGKITSKITVEDYSELIKNEKVKMTRDNGFSWTAYYDIDEINDYLRNMSMAHPESAKLIVGGQSYEGREILGLRIRSPTRKNAQTIFIESGIHAREWIAPATTTYFINELLTSNDPEIQQLKNRYDWHIFPSVNPDGYHYSYNTDRMWRKTRSRSSLMCYGADPNRNWDYNWLEYGTTNNPCDYQTYGGSKAFSEIETKSLSNYISSLDNLKAYVGFHSDAQALLIPYSDSTEHDEYYDDLKKIGLTSLEYGYRVNKAKYRGPATAAEILYKASGGSMDWVHQTRRVPLAYTYELRGYMFYWPPSRIPEQGDEVTQMMLGLVTEARNLGYL